MPGAFRVGEREIRAICNLFARLGAIKLTATCSDRVTREFSSVEQLLAYENPETKRIVGLTVAVRPADYSASKIPEHTFADVVFNSQWSGGISISVDAPDEIATRLKGQLRDILSSVRPWYAVLHKIDFHWAFLGVFVAFFVVAIVLLGKAEPKPLGDSPGALGATYLKLGAIITAVQAAGSVVNALRNKFFPAKCILIGQAQERDKKVEPVQKIVITLVLGAVGAAGTWMLRLLWRIW
jgi:hypothetical protein